MVEKGGPISKLSLELVKTRSLLHTLKVELIHGKTYNTRQEAKTAIFEHIEGVYNRQHHHSCLSYLSPEVFEKKNMP